MRLMPLFLAAALAVVPACATEPTDDTETLAEALADPRVGEKVNRICFSRGINGFSEWDGPDGIILRRGVNDRYLVLVARGCFNIDDAQRIGIDQRFGGGCLSRGDRLFISRSIFPNPRDRFDVDRCTITAIYEWDEDAAEEDGEDGASTDEAE